jgi:glutaminase
MHTLRHSFARFSSSRVVRLAVALAALASTACVHEHVAPYQRTRLAHPTMVTAGMSSVMDSHVRAIQEGATGGEGGGSSGCGCN